jgi:hypothetical protein
VEVTRAVFLFMDQPRFGQCAIAPNVVPASRTAEEASGSTLTYCKSGVDTYTVTCVAPQEFESRRERVVAYLRRDREFVLGLLLWVPLGLVTLSLAMSVWASFVLVATAVAVVSFAWATK